MKAGTSDPKRENKCKKKQVEDWRSKMKPEEPWNCKEVQAEKRKDKMKPEERIR